jgi:hypothetical protein
MKGWNSMAMNRQALPFSVLDAVATTSKLFAPHEQQDHHLKRLQRIR